MSIDVHRSAVYRAEDQWSTLLDRGGRLDFFGTVLDIPMQLRFGDLTSMQTYVDALVPDPPRVRVRKGQTRAHYEPEECVIAIPMESTWAARESVLLHELAHHLAHIHNNHVQHGAPFTGHMLQLVEAQLGEPAALVLRTGYHESGALVPVS
jgi:putative metallohydrolase (TIGR04338 family)